MGKQKNKSSPCPSNVYNVGGRARHTRYEKSATSTSLINVFQMNEECKLVLQ